MWQTCLQHNRSSAFYDEADTPLDATIASSGRPVDEAENVLPTVVEHPANQSPVVSSGSANRVPLIAAGAVAVVAAVWYAFKAFGRRGAGQLDKRRGRPAAPTDSHDAAGEIEDLVQCALCGTYIQPGAVACERPDCPHRA